MCLVQETKVDSAPAVSADQLVKPWSAFEMTSSTPSSTAVKSHSQDSAAESELVTVLITRNGEAELEFLMDGESYRVKDPAAFAALAQATTHAPNPGVTAPSRSR